MLIAFGVALAFPIITLLILDMYPRQRGAASSLQAFISLSLNAIIAGVIAAAIGANALMLATTTAAFSVCAGLLWWHHQRRSRGHADTTIGRASCRERVCQYG